MPFGIGGIGDGVAVVKLIRDIISCLRDASGAKDEYQTLVRELDLLQTTLSRFNVLEATLPSSANLEHLKYTALNCSYALESFYDKIKQRYGASLDVQSKRKGFRGTKDKLLWGFNMNEEVQRLQKYLNVHISLINTALIQFGLQAMEAMAKNLESGNRVIREEIFSTGNEIKQSMMAATNQIKAVQTTQSVVSDLIKSTSGEVKSSQQVIIDSVAKS